MNRCLIKFLSSGQPNFEMSHAGPRYDRFHQSGHNSEFDRVQPDIEEALQANKTKVVACMVYLGNPLAPPAIRDLDQLKMEQNELKEWFDWRDVGLLTIHRWLTEEHAVVSLDVRLTLERWNNFLTPRRAVYGLVKAAELGMLYQQHGNGSAPILVKALITQRAIQEPLSQ